MADRQRELQQAIRNQDRFRVRQLLEEVAPADGLLVDAVEAAAPEILELLLHAGAVPGSQPLVVIAASRGSLRVVKVLIRRCPCHVRRFAEQAAQVARERGHREIYEALLGFRRARERFACRTGP